MKRAFIFVTGLIILWAGTASAMHHGGGKQCGDMQQGQKWWQQPAVVELISLSADEQATAEDLWTQHRRNMIKLKGNLHAHVFDLKVLDDNADADRIAVREQFEAVQRARSDIDTERFNYRMAVRSFLGAERFHKIRSYFYMPGQDHRKDDHGMQTKGCGKAKMGMGCGGRGHMHGGCPMCARMKKGMAHGAGDE